MNFLCEKQGARGKHRTEVTEVTEGDWVGGRKLFSERGGLLCENQAQRGKASHGGHGGHGGDRIGGRNLFGERGGLLCENQAQGESIERRSRRGLGRWAKSLR
jgi:hypothetical protein